MIFKIGSIVKASRKYYYDLYEDQVGIVLSRKDGFTFDTNTTLVLQTASSSLDRRFCSDSLIEVVTK